MKHLFLFFIFIQFALISISQITKNDISKYTLPDIKRQQLDFNFQGTGGKTSQYLFYEYGNQTDTLDHKNNQFAGDYDIAYSYYRNSKRVQSKMNIMLYGHYNNNYVNSNKYYLQDYSDLTNHLSLNSDFKYYITTSKWFLTVIPGLNINYRKYNDRKSDFEIKDLYAGCYTGIGGGFGRIEQVQDFRHAVLLINEIEKRGISKRILSEEEVLEFAALISRLKNKRFFDYRKQKETELTALDSFLVEKEIIKEKSIQYFNGLEDMWSYGGLQLRESGNQIIFYGTPEYTFDKDFKKDQNNMDENLLIKYDLAFISKNPVSLKWQFDYDLGISHSFLNRLRKQNTNLAEKTYSSKAFVNGNLGYFPNTRTAFYLNGNLGVFNISDEKILDNEKYSVSFQVITSAYYYISEKLRLGYSVQFTGSEYGIFNSNKENTYYKRIGYSLNLNYAIF